MRAEGEELFAGRTPHQGIRGNHTSGVVMRNVQTWRFDVYLTPALSVKLATVSRSADPNLANPCPSTKDGSYSEGDQNE